MLGLMEHKNRQAVFGLGYSSSNCILENLDWVREDKDRETKCKTAVSQYQNVSKISVNCQAPITKESMNFIAIEFQ